MWGMEVVMGMAVVMVVVVLVVVIIINHTSFMTVAMATFIIAGIAKCQQRVSI